MWSSIRKPNNVLSLGEGIPGRGQCSNPSETDAYYVLRTERPEWQKQCARGSRKWVRVRECQIVTFRGFSPNCGFQGQCKILSLSKMGSHCQAFKQRRNMNWLLFLFIYLKYSWFGVFFLTAIAKINQLYIYILFHIYHYDLSQDIELVPCAIQQDLIYWFLFLDSLCFYFENRL